MVNFIRSLQFDIQVHGEMMQINQIKESNKLNEPRKKTKIKNKYTKTPKNSGESFRNASVGNSFGKVCSRVRCAFVCMFGAFQ